MYVNSPIRHIYAIFTPREPLPFLLIPGANCRVENHLLSGIWFGDGENGYFHRVRFGRRAIMERTSDRFDWKE